MPIDASIPLGIQMPKLLTPFEAQSNAQSLQAQMQAAQIRQQELVQGQQAMRDQMELSTLAATPGNIDPKTGTFTAEAITQIRNPLLRQKLNQERIDTQLKSAEIARDTSQAGQEADKRKTDALHSLFENAYSVYESTLTATGSKQVATEAFNKAQSDGFKELKDTGRGGFSADTNFRVLTPDDVAAKLITHKDRVEEQAKKDAAERGEETPFIKESRYLDTLKGKLADLKPTDPASGPLRQQIAQLQAHIAKLDAPARTQISLTPMISTAQEGLHGDEYMKTLPAAERNRVSMMLDGSLKPTEISMRNGEREKALAQARQADPSFDPGAATVNRAIELDFAKGKPAQSLQSINAVTEHLDTYLGLAKALDNGDVQLYNKWRAKFQVETGKTLPNNLEQAAPIIGLPMNFHMAASRPGGTSDGRD